MLFITKLLDELPAVPMENMKQSKRPISRAYLVAMCVETRWVFNVDCVHRLAGGRSVACGRRSCSIAACIAMILRRGCDGGRIDGSDMVTTRALD